MPVSSKVIDRFFRHVDKCGPCWVWTASRIECRNTKTYGQFCISHNEHILAHRFSWQIHFGPIPDNLFVCHKCDNPICVNPGHLFLGTHSDNMLDMKSKHRGRSSGRAFTDQQASFIKRSKMSAGQLAIYFRVSPNTIKQIRSGITYRWVP